MNSFGRLFQVSVFGESHGPCVGVLVDGCPAGLSVSAADLEADLARRRPGAPGTTTRRELDEPLIDSGLLDGKATGAPMLIRFANQDVDSTAYRRVGTIPRPGHADLTARRKFSGHNDSRGSGHFSGRLTVGVVAAGAIAKKLIAPTTVSASLLEAGGSADIATAVAAAADRGDSVGGIVECRAAPVTAGLGEPFFDGAESLLSHLIFAIGGVRGIEFGAGFQSAGMLGSECNDAIEDATGTTTTNHAGGINGGITNGNELVFRVAIKPTSSIRVPQQTVDLDSGERTSISVAGRHDACIALRVPVIIEACTAIVLADSLLLQQALSSASRAGPA